MSGGTPGTGDAAASDDRRPAGPGKGSQRSGPRAAGGAEAKLRGQGGRASPHSPGEAGARGVAATERLPDCRREGRARRRGRERAPETTAAGTRFLLGRLPDRSPPAGQSPAECPACSARHCYGAPKGAGGGVEGGASRERGGAEGDRAGSSWARGGAT